MALVKKNGTTASSRCATMMCHQLLLGLAENQKTLYKSTTYTLPGGEGVFQESSIHAVSGACSSIYRPSHRPSSLPLASPDTGHSGPPGTKQIKNSCVGSGKV